MPGTTLRFPIRFDRGYGAISRMLLVAPSDSFVEVAGDDVRVRMGWAFRASFPRSAVASAADLRRRPLARGVHGWAGRGLVNGSGDGVVELSLRPEQGARVLGVPVRLRTLLVSVDAPAARRAALTG